MPNPAKVLTITDPENIFWKEFFYGEFPSGALFVCKSVCVRVCEFVCVSVCARERESVCVCEREREGKRGKSVCVLQYTGLEYIRMTILRLMNVWFMFDSCYTHTDPLQHTAAHCNTLQHTATHCNTLQPTATHGNARQHTTTHYNKLQQTAPHCNTRTEL